jgi:hypothetical protein
LTGKASENMINKKVQKSLTKVKSIRGKIMKRAVTRKASVAD